jgi:hypothetical protein
MLRVECDVHIGSITASTTPQREARQLLSLLGELAMGGVGGRCVVEIADPSLSPPALGDSVQVSLGTGNGTTPVFTGEVREVARTATALRITALDGLATLATFELETVYENKSAGAIVKDVLGQAGVTAGTVEDGPTLATWVMHKGPRALRHLQRLAELCGADLFSDGEGKVCFTTPSTQGDSHTFKYGGELLALHLEDAPPAFDSFSVWGEGAASSQGAGKEHWLIKDLSSVNGKAAVGSGGSVTPGQEGDRPQLVVDGALRSGEAAKAVAEARAAAVAARAVRGSLQVLGAPEVKPGDAVTVEDLPGSGAAPGPLRVRRVRHRLDSRVGFVTRVDF